MQIDWSQGFPVMAGPFQMGHAEQSPETVGYWEGIRAGELRIKRCAGCGKLHHPRRILCMECGSEAFDWVTCEGAGTVYTFSTVYRAPVREFDHDIPYTVGVIELREGVFVFSRILPPEGGEVSIGARVSLTFRECGSHGMLPAFQIIG
jgi:uncharacterized OB-fold protein